MTDWHICSWQMTGQSGREVRWKKSCGCSGTKTTFDGRPSEADLAREALQRQSAATAHAEVQDVLERAAVAVEARFVSDAEEEFGETLAWLLRSIRNGRDLATVRERSAQLARVILDEWVVLSHDSRCDSGLCGHPACAIRKAVQEGVSAP